MGRGQEGQAPCQGRPRAGASVRRRREVQVGVGLAVEQGEQLCGTSMHMRHRHSCM